MKLIVTAGALALSLLSPTAWAQSLDPSAGLFGQSAGMSNAFEIEESKIMIEDSKDPNLVAFAKRMVEDHGLAQAELRQAGMRAGVATDIAFDSVTKKKVDNLGLMDSPKLEQTYVDDQLKSHALAAGNLSGYIATGTNPVLVAYARKALPVVLMHKQMLERMTGMQAPL